MVVLRSEPIAPDVASEIDSRSTPIFESAAETERQTERDEIVFF